MLVALAGGVGAARFLRGLVGLLDQKDLTVVVNTADDIRLYDLYISPDLDSVIYGLAGANDPERGWGIQGDTFRCLEALKRYTGPTWFRLGDVDLATHLYRSWRIRSGATLSEVTAEIARAWGVRSTVIPMSDQEVTTRVIVEQPGSGPRLDLHFQEYLVERRAQDRIISVYYHGVQQATPAPGVMEAIRNASGIIVCPSNPVASIGPILAVPGIRDALRDFPNKIVAVSPLIQGQPVRGPADRMMEAVGLEASCIGVADAYRDFIHAIVIDFVDREAIPDIEALEVEPIPAQTLMRGVPQAKALAKTVLEAVEAEM
ncbi:MAG: 2-phospho-L-lactate transferase [Acidimicrobiia bacterium]